MIAFRTSALVVALLSLALPGCGKKGPPLAPLLEVPAAAQDVASRREGAVATLQFRIPDVNTSGTRPADLVRMEVYGLTGAMPPRVDLAKDVVKYGTLVASVPVRKPPEEEEEGASPRQTGASPKGTAEPEPQATPVRPPSSMQNGFDQGEAVVVIESIGPAQRAVVEIPSRKGSPPAVPRDPWLPRIGPAPGLDDRLYFIVGVNHRGRRGTMAPPQAVALHKGPSTPAQEKIGYDEKAFNLSWEPPADLPRPVQPPAAEGELASTPIGIQTTVAGYNVYEAVRAAQPGGAPSPPAVSGTLAKPLNQTLLAAPALTLPGVEFGKERCFVVRAAAQSGTQVVESEPTPPLCATPRDTFPPAAPKGLSAVASEGAVSLIWEANGEADLAGYLVLRAEPGRQAQALTPQPIKETTYRDATAASGVRYAYTVVAIDAAGNRSAPSNAVEEAAR